MGPELCIKAACQERESCCCCQFPWSTCYICTCTCMRAGACTHATSSPLMERAFRFCGNSEPTFYRAASGNDPVSIALQQGDVFCLELAKSWLTWTSDQAKSHPIRLKRIAEPRPAGILHSQACTTWPGWGGGATSRNSW